MAERRPDGFVDTSVFIRFFTRDDETRAERARALLEAADTGDVTLHVNHLSFAEIAYALRSQYGLPRASIAERLQDLLDVRGIKVPDKPLIASAIELYADRSTDFGDAYFVADMRKRRLRSIYAYDSDYDKLGVRRIEP